MAGELSGPRVVALGGGHGLAASLSALRGLTERLTAVVTVADDGGSSGRLRKEFGTLPPGDLRMALAALCGDDASGRAWAEVVQHRFASDGDLHGHAVGNLLIIAMTQLLGDPVAALDVLGALLGARGRVLPMSVVPLDIVAQVVGLDPRDPGAVSTVRGQGEVAITPGRVAGVRLDPEDPPACDEAVAAIGEADLVVLGPGSWFTSVLPHLLVPDLENALRVTKARKVLALNLTPQVGETDGFSPEAHLDVLAAHAPDFRVDVVLADTHAVRDTGTLREAARELGASLVLAPVAAADDSARHDPVALAAAYAGIFAQGVEEKTWR